MASLTLDYPEDFKVDLETIQKLIADFKETSTKIAESKFDITTKEMKQLIKIYVEEYEKAGKLIIKEPMNDENMTIFPAIVRLRESILAMIALVYSHLVTKLEDKNAQSKKTLDVIVENVTKMIKKHPEEFTEVLDELGLTYVGKTEKV